MTSVGGDAGKKCGFSIMVYGSKEKRRRLDVRKLGNDEMQQLKCCTFNLVRQEAGLPDLPRGIFLRDAPARFLFQKANSAREKALEHDLDHKPMGESSPAHKHMVHFEHLLLCPFPHMPIFNHVIAQMFTWK